ncbi:hypothetical protein JCM16358_06310 [Halanaerocella petrolearia]
MNTSFKKGTMVFLLVTLFMLGTSSVFAVSLPLKTDVSKQQRRVEAYKQIRNANPQGRLAFGDIERLYDGILKNMVEARDEEFGTTMNQYIKAAFNGAKNGQNPQVAAQIVDKTLKRAFYLTVQHELIEAVEEFSNKEEAHHKLDEAIVYYEPIAGTAKKRDQGLHEDILSGMRTARQAIKNNNLSKLKIADQIIDKTIIKVFYASVLHEAEEVEEYVTENSDKAKVKQIEGLVYYQGIKGIVKANNKLGNLIIEPMLSKDIANVDYGVILKELNRGFVPKVIHYLEEVEENWGTNKALVEAWEALLYYNVFATDVEAKLGTESASELLSNLRSYVQAVKKEDKSTVDKLAEDIETQIKAYFVKL